MKDNLFSGGFAVLMLCSFSSHGAASSSSSSHVQDQARETLIPERSAKRAMPSLVELALRALVEKEYEERPIKRARTPQSGNWAGIKTPIMLRISELINDKDPAEIEEADINAIVGLYWSERHLDREVPYRAIASEVAKRAYLAHSIAIWRHSPAQASRAIAERSFMRLSSFLKGHFKGVSIKDLLGEMLLPSARAGADGGLWLNLSELFISDLTGLENVPRIEDISQLTLEKNEITTIDPEAFRGFDRLQTLELAENKISTIDLGAWKGLNELMNLDLNDNRMTYIDDRTFGGLGKLSVLDLVSNQITTIGLDAFMGHSMEFHVNLRFNQITTIDRHAFRGLTDEATIDLRDNGMSESMCPAIRDTTPATIWCGDEPLEGVDAELNDDEYEALIQQWLHHRN